MSERTIESEPLNYDQLGNLISSVGNSEAKAIALLLMRSGQAYSAQLANREFIRAQGLNPAWNASPNIPYAYCEHSFEPSGLVESVEEDGIRYFVITPLGETKGKAIASLLLVFSERYPDISLREVFGGTQSSVRRDEESEQATDDSDKKRAATVRLKIFSFLKQVHGAVRRQDVADAIDEPVNVVGEHLDSLRTAGIISYNSKLTGFGQSEHRLAMKRPEKPPDTTAEFQHLTQLVFDIFDSAPGSWFSFDNVADLISEQAGVSSTDRGELVNKIVMCVSSLTHQGYLTKLSGEGFTQVTQSEIILLPDQRDFLRDLTDTVASFQSGNPGIIANSKSLGHEILNDPARVSALIEKYRESSPYSNRTTIADTYKLLESILLEHGELTARDIRTLLAAKHGKEIGPRGFNKTLNLLEAQGKIKSRGKTGKLYSLVN